jgi:hypothetical protein
MREDELLQARGRTGRAQRVSRRPCAHPHASRGFFLSTITRSVALPDTRILRCGPTSFAWRMRKPNDRDGVRTTATRFLILVREAQLLRMREITRTNALSFNT